WPLAVRSLLQVRLDPGGHVIGCALREVQLSENGVEDASVAVRNALHRDLVFQMRLVKRAPVHHGWVVIIPGTPDATGDIKSMLPVGAVLDRFEGDGDVEPDDG